MNPVETENFIILENITNEKLQLGLKYLINVFLDNYISIKHAHSAHTFRIHTTLDHNSKKWFHDRHNAALRFIFLHIAITTTEGDFCLITPNNKVTLLCCQAKIVLALFYIFNIFSRDKIDFFVEF